MTTYDIGDAVVITTRIGVDGTPVDPVGVSLDLTAPDGTTSTPAVQHISTGVYEVAFTASQPGRWLFKWTASTPDSVEHGHIDVLPNPPPPGRLAPLASITDLEDRLGRTLTDEEAAKAPALLRDASAKIRAFCRQSFDYVTGDVVTLREVGYKLTLPERPVTAVTSVVALSGHSELADVTLTGWQWDGLDQINLRGLSEVIVNLPEWWHDTPGGPGTFRVTYDHGYPTTPDDIVAKTCELATRVLTSPSPTEGMGSERAGPFSYTMAPGAGTFGAAVRLTKQDRDDLVAAGYRRAGGAIQMRA